MAIRFPSSRKEACPKLVAYGIHVMTQGQGRAGVSIGVNKLIVELKNKFHGIERPRAVGVHGQVRDRLVSKEIRFAFQLEKTIDPERPIEFFKQEQKTRIDRILL